MVRPVEVGYNSLCPFFERSGSGFIGLGNNIFEVFVIEADGVGFADELVPIVFVGTHAEELGMFYFVGLFFGEFDGNAGIAIEGDGETFVGQVH